MDRTTDFNTGFEVRYSTTDHRYHATLHGVEVGAGWTYMAEAAAQAPYQVLTDAAGDPPVDIPDEPDDAPPGGEEPPDIWFARQGGADCAAAHALGSGPPVWWELLAAAPTPPAPSPLPSAAGGDAASAAGLWFARQRWAQQRAAALGLTHGRAA